MAIDNLVDLIKTCIDHPAAANETFLVVDGAKTVHHTFAAARSACLGEKGQVAAIALGVLKLVASIVGACCCTTPMGRCRSISVKVANCWVEVPPTGFRSKAMRQTASHYLDK